MTTRVGQLPAATSIATTDYIPVEQGGVLKRANPTLLPFVQSGSGLSSTTVEAQLQKSEFFDTIAALKLWSAPTVSVTAFVRGYYASGDGGGGMFKWSGSDSTTDNGGTVIKPTAVLGNGRWNRINERLVSVLAFGAKGDGSTDDHDAFANAIAALYAVYVPKAPSAADYLIGSNIPITKPVKLVGDGVGATAISRNYSPSNDYDGVFAFQDGGTEGIISDMTIRSLSGQSGGCLVSIKPSASGTLGLFNFSNLDLTTTGTDTHKYTFYADGTARTSAPIGIRGLHFNQCAVFGAQTKAMYLAGVVHGSFVGGQVNSAGGTSGAVQFTGTSGVKTQDFLFAPQDFNGGLDFDFATNITVASGEVSGITNTSNTSNILVLGPRTSGSVQDNWTSSAFFDPVNGIKLPTGIALHSRAKSASAAVNFSGTAPDATATTNGQTFTFTFQGNAMFFSVALGGGQAALFFANQASSTISILSDVSAVFENSSSPTGGKSGVFKSSSSRVISIKNNTGSAANYSVMAVDRVASVTDPA